MTTAAPLPMTHGLQASIRTDKGNGPCNAIERTRHLIELGGLVVKAGLVELTDDDRAVIFGGLLAVADKLQSDDCDHALAATGKARLQGRSVKFATSLAGRRGELRSCQIPRS